MHIYTAADIRRWDEFTLSHQSISPLELMERAANAVADWIRQKFPVGYNTKFCMICGPGNNGGDGLALARLLYKEYDVQVVAISNGRCSDCFSKNLEALQSLPVQVNHLDFKDQMPKLEQGTVIIDAMFGTGLNRPPEGIFQELIHYINHLENQVIAIDIPSGMYSDGFTPHPHIIAAHFTLSLQCAKLAFMMPENEQMLGSWQVLNIGLDESFPQTIASPYSWIDHPANWINAKHYGGHTHKGLRGHLLLGAGSATMMGAAILATRSALRSGAGLVTIATDSAGWPTLQISAPEAICAAAASLGNSDFQLQRRIKSIALGPGWIADDHHLQHLAFIWQQCSLPVVADATALTLLGELLPNLQVQERTSTWIITPHVGEFDRLFGYSTNHAERLQKAIEAAEKYQLIILLKGRYSRIVCPDGRVFFNSTGNHGMAKGGSGDVLTGLIGGLLAQGYRPLEACILGAWIHGKAGDIASSIIGTECMTAQHIIDAFPEAFSCWLQVTPGENRNANEQLAF